MTTPRSALTIFKKMLLAPLAGVLLYSAYLLYIHNEQKTSRERIEQIRTDYLPALELTEACSLLFDEIADGFKDAVLAGEVDWALNTQQDKKQIDEKLAHLGRHASVVSAAEVAATQEAFARYYDNAYALSMLMLQGSAGNDESDRLIEDVKRFHGQAAAGFEGLHTALLNRFAQRVEETNERVRRQVQIAVLLGIALIVVIVGVTVVISLSTRKALREVIGAFMNMAQDSPDFSRRLQRASNDELGELIGWFNLLADKLEANYKQIELLSTTDKLTQLYNRAKIDELFGLELGKAQRYGARLCVVMIDMDHFKEVNDSHGHQTGDAVLRDLAGILRQSVRATDHLGRWGGEEFIVLLPNTELAHGCQLAEKLRETISSHAFPVVGHKTGSFGVASWHDGDSEDSLTHRADACLYIAKRQGRDRVIDETALAAAH